MRKPLLLIADDEKRICRLVSDFMRNAGFETISAYDGEEALEIFYENGSKISLVILDVMMPKIDGWEVLRRIRDASRVLAVMLTARGEESDQIAAFRAGADDYVTKPFSPSVLVARVESLLRRNNKWGGSAVKFGTITLDTQTRMIDDGDGTETLLTPKEYDLLMYLADNPGIALSREKLLNAVWNYDYFGDVRTVDTHVKQLRAKMGAEAGRIATVRGLGYRFRPENETAAVNFEHES